MNPIMQSLIGHRVSFQQIEMWLILYKDWAEDFSSFKSSITLKCSTDPEWYLGEDDEIEAHYKKFKVIFNTFNNLLEGQKFEANAEKFMNEYHENSVTRNDKKDWMLRSENFYIELLCELILCLDNENISFESPLVFDETPFDTYPVTIDQEPIKNCLEFYKVWNQLFYEEKILIERLQEYERQNNVAEKTDYISIGGNWELFCAN